MMDQGRQPAPPLALRHARLAPDRGRYWQQRGPCRGEGRVAQTCRVTAIHSKHERPRSAPSLLPGLRPSSRVILMTGVARSCRGVIDSASPRVSSVAERPRAAAPFGCTRDDTRGRAVALNRGGWRTRISFINRDVVRPEMMTLAHNALSDLNTRDPATSLETRQGKLRRLFPVQPAADAVHPDVRNCPSRDTTRYDDARELRR